MKKKLGLKKVMFRDLDDATLTGVAGANDQDSNGSPFPCGYTGAPPPTNQGSCEASCPQSCGGSCGCGMSQDSCGWTCVSCHVTCDNTCGTCTPTCANAC